MNQPNAVASAGLMPGICMKNEDTALANGTAGIGQPSGYISFPSGQRTFWVKSDSAFASWSCHDVAGGASEAVSVAAAWTSPPGTTIAGAGVVTGTAARADSLTA